MSGYTKIANGKYKYDMDFEQVTDSLDGGEFQLRAMQGDFGSTASFTTLSNQWIAGVTTAAGEAHQRTILKIKMPDKPSDTGDIKITELFFQVNVENGSASVIDVHPISIPASSLDMSDATWAVYDSGVSWSNPGCDHDDSTDFGFGGNGKLISQVTASNGTTYTFNLSAYADKLEWGDEFAFLFKTSSEDNSPSSTVSSSRLSSVDNTTVTTYFHFTDTVPKQPQIKATAKQGGLAALIEVDNGGDSDLNDLLTVFRNDNTAPTTGDNPNAVTNTNPGVLDTSKTSHFDAGILSAENTRYRVALYARDEASSYVSSTSGITRSNIIDLVRPKINSVVINNSFNTIGVEGQLTVTATTGGNWSTYGAAALKFVYVVWEGASSGVTIDDDDVAKIEIPEADASSVVLKHTYSSAGTKNVWIALEDINGFRSGLHRIDDSGDITTQATLPDVDESNPICKVTASKSKFLAAKFADYNTGLIVSAAQSKAIGTTRKIQNYLFTCKAGLATTIVTKGAFDNNNDVFDSVSKRVAVRALTDINVSSARFKITGLASFNFAGTPAADDSDTFANYKMTSETISPPDAVLTEGSTAGTASDGANFNTGNYTYNYFKSVESVVVTTTDTDDTEGVRYILTALVADWDSVDTGATITEDDDDGSELTLNVSDATPFRSGDVIVIDSEFMKVTASDTDNNRLQITRQYLGTTGNSGVGSGASISLANPIVINSDIRWASAPTDTDFHDRYRWGGFARIKGSTSGSGTAGIDFDAFDATDNSSNTIKLEEVDGSNSSFNGLCWYENGFFDDDIIAVGNTSNNGSYASPKYFKLASFITSANSDYETAIVHGTTHDLPSFVTNSVSNENNTSADIVRVITSPSRTVAAVNTDSTPRKDTILFEARIIDDDTDSFLVRTDVDVVSSNMVQPRTVDFNTVGTHGDFKLLNTDIAILNADKNREGGLATLMPLGERKYPVGLTRTTMGLPTMAVNLRILSQVAYETILSLIEGDTYDYIFMDSTKVSSPASAYVTFRMKLVNGALQKSPEIANEYLASLTFVIVGEAVTV